ncbi:MAG: ABC transporter ATP-binding protein [Alphaproteobacteria bacterium]|nr:ABC transporter ATP-binding protein [Alphaproteobacteria bacterium]
MMATPLLEVADLRVSFAGDNRRDTLAVDGIGFSLRRGRTLGIVGESGSGKSVTSLAIMGLLPKDTARVGGSVRFDGEELLRAPEGKLRDLRGDRMAMIFQEPMTSLNPSYTIGDQIGEAVIRHRGASKREARARAIEMLRRVRIPSPEQRVDDYPHKLSGGMRQRAMIAMALACDPRLLIADEPTTALDVTIQAQILDLLRDLRAEGEASIILITHDLGVVAELVDEVAVMYAGQIVERAPVEMLFSQPQHPYTVGLLGSLPRLDQKRERLAAIDGAVPDMTAPPPGCRFAARCPFAEPACREGEMPTIALADSHVTRCRRAPLERLVA